MWIIGLYLIVTMLAILTARIANNIATNFSEKTPFFFCIIPIFNIVVIFVCLNWIMKYLFDNQFLSIKVWWLKFHPGLFIANKYMAFENWFINNKNIKH